MNETAPRLEAFRVPPCKGGEQRNTEHPDETGRWNGSGTPSLKALAEQAFSRLKSGTPAERKAEQDSKRGVSLTPQSVSPVSGCPHVTEDWLREWYAEHPEVVDALRSAYGEFPEVPLDRTRAGRKWREEQARPPTSRER